MTPAERNAVLEEAAQHLDNKACDFRNVPPEGKSMGHVLAGAFFSDAANAIRALKEQEPTT